jgi:hypothetical protein
VGGRKGGHGQQIVVDRLRRADDDFDFDCMMCGEGCS